MIKKIYTIKIDDYFREDENDSLIKSSRELGGSLREYFKLTEIEIDSNHFEKIELIFSSRFRAITPFLLDGFLGSSIHYFKREKFKNLYFLSSPDAGTQEAIERCLEEVICRNIRDPLFKPEKYETEKASIEQRQKILYQVLYNLSKYSENIVLTENPPTSPEINIKNLFFVMFHIDMFLHRKFGGFYLYPDWKSVEYNSMEKSLVVNSQILLADLLDMKSIFSPLDVTERKYFFRKNFFDTLKGKFFSKYRVIVQNTIDIFIEDWMLNFEISKILNLSNTSYWLFSEKLDDKTKREIVENVRKPMDSK